MPTIEDVLRTAVKEGWGFRYHPYYNDGNLAFQLWNKTYMTWVFVANVGGFEEAIKLMSPVKKWGLFRPDEQTWIATDCAPYRETTYLKYIATIEAPTPPDKDAFRLIFSAYSRKFADGATVKEVPDEDHD